MQVSIETTEDLERKMTVQVPAEKIEETINKRLHEISTTAKLPGFRPGKVPLKHVQKRFSKEVRTEVLGETIQNSFMAALKDKKLNIIGQPEIVAKQYEVGQDFIFEAVFEIYPLIELAPIEEMLLDKPELDISEDNVSTIVERLRKQHIQWEIKEGPAEKNDRVLLNYRGLIEGQSFDESDGDDVSIVIGEGKMIAGFEDKLLHTKKDDKIKMELTFPVVYHNQSLQGKAVVFNIEVLSVFSPKLPEVNEDFVKLFGIKEGNIAAFRDDVKKNIMIESKKMIFQQVKDKVITALLDKNKISLPKKLIAIEVEHLKKQETSKEETYYTEKAEKRVTLGLLFSELVQKANIDVSDEKVSAMINQLSAQFEEPAMMREYYHKDEQNLEMIKRMVLEDQAVEWILNKAKVTTTAIDFDTLFAEDVPNV